VRVVDCHLTPALSSGGGEGGAEVLRRCDEVSERLEGKEFTAELRRVIAVAAANPGRFHLSKPGFHRANLKRFPYHFIYRELADGIRVTLVRHHRRNPDYGMEGE
jgi:hypothetical protein